MNLFSGIPSAAYYNKYANWCVHYPLVVHNAKSIKQGLFPLDLWSAFDPRIVLVAGGYF